MGFTKLDKNISVHQQMSDYPNQDTGISADELKKKFDYPAEVLKEAFNQLIDELLNNSASNKIGAGKIGTNDNSENNVYSKLVYLYDSISNAILGQIPNDTITREKLEPNYESTLAKKDGELQNNLNAEKINDKTINDIGLRNKILQTGLNAEMLGGETLEQVLKHKNYVYGTYTGTTQSATDSQKQTINIGFTPNIIILIKNVNGTKGSEVFICFENIEISGLKIVENGFTISGIEFNASSSTNKYGYIALK